jgi:hypothetical protein
LAAEEWPRLERLCPVVSGNEDDGDRQVCGVACGAAGELKVAGGPAVGGEVGGPVDGVGVEEAFEPGSVHLHPGAAAAATCPESRPTSTFCSNAGTSKKDATFRHAFEWALPMNAEPIIATPSGGPSRLVPLLLSGKFMV